MKDDDDEDGSGAEGKDDEDEPEKEESDAEDSESEDSESDGSDGSDSESEESEPEVNKKAHKYGETIKTNIIFNTCRMPRMRKRKQITSHVLNDTKDDWQRLRKEICCARPIWIDSSTKLTKCAMNQSHCSTTWTLFCQSWVRFIAKIQSAMSICL